MLNKIKLRNILFKKVTPI